MTNCWKDQNPPSNTSLIWVKLNENGDIHGYFKYEGGKWVVKKRKELEEEESSADYSELINSLATVATTGSYNDLSDQPNIPTATSSKPFKASWPTNSTIEAFCQAVMNDPDAVVGMAYLGALSCSGLPAGLGIGDTIVEILGSNSNKVVHLEISSTNMAPYNWEASYWQGNLYGWRTWENTDNKVTSISNSSTDTQYPSAKAVYDAVDAKYTKPVTGIPASDLAEGVIPEGSDDEAKEVAAAALCELHEHMLDKDDVADTLDPVVNAHYRPASSYALYSLKQELLKDEEVLATSLNNLEALKVVLNAIAPSYNSGTRTFTVGQYCMYESELYRCITAVSTPEPFNPLKWEKVSVITVINEVLSKINPPIETTQPVSGFLPGIIYDLGELSANTTFALATPTDNTVPNAYHWTFDTGSTAPTVQWPSGIIFPDGVTPTVEADKHYEVLIRNNYASIIVFSIPILP